MFRKIFKPEYLFFIALLVTGLRVYDDFGLSFDESIQRSENGYVNYNYILTGNDSILLNSPEKYHGPAFEIFLVWIEKVFNITDDRSIFLSRHLSTFLLFFTGVIFFYFLAKDYFVSKNAALLSCAILVLTPRIFADAFYNSKDIAFLSIFIISIYFLTRFLKEGNFISVAIHALFSGILLDIRILGVLVPVFTVAFFLLDKTLKINEGKLFQDFGYVLLYLALSVLFTILFWPVLWTGPVTHFMNALSEMSNFPWNGDVVYLGKIYLAAALPWHYIPVWIFVSTPVMYCVLFCGGIMFTAFRLLKAPIKLYRDERETLIFMGWFFVPVTAVVLLDSTVYDGWRHLYFIYPAFVLLSVKGLYLALEYLEEKNFAIGKRILNVIILISLGYVIVAMILMHPYQNVYFNFLAGNPEKKFERDYWGLSYRQGLEYILNADTSDKIMYTGSNADVPLNERILPKNDRDRLVFTNYFQFADYYLDNYRWNRDPNQPLDEIFSLKTMNIKIMSVYKVQHKKSDNILLDLENDFEQAYMGYGSYKDTVVGAGAYSGTRVCMIDSNDIFSLNLNIQYDSLTQKRQAMAVYFSAETFALDADSVPFMVVSVSDMNHKDLFWTAARLKDHESSQKKWQKIVFEAEIPKNIVAPNQLKAYIWNPFKAKMYIDVFKLKIIKANE